MITMAPPMMIRARTMSPNPGSLLFGEQQSGLHLDMPLFLSHLP
jgi:hypothetical protein